MRAIVRILRQFCADTKGATAVEYGFILAMVVLALMVGLRALGNANNGVWSDIHTKIQATQ